MRCSKGCHFGPRRTRTKACAGSSVTHGADPGPGTRRLRGSLDPAWTDLVLEARPTTGAKKPSSTAMSRPLGGNHG